MLPLSIRSSASAPEPPLNEDLLPKTTELPGSGSVGGADSDVDTIGARTG